MYKEFSTLYHVYNAVQEIVKKKMNELMQYKLHWFSLSWLTLARLHI